MLKVHIIFYSITIILVEHFYALFLTLITTSDWFLLIALVPAFAQKFVGVLLVNETTILDSKLLGCQVLICHVFDGASLL